MNIGQRIKDIRISKNISQDDLAACIHKSKASIKKYEGGQTTITLETLSDIAKALDVTLLSIITDSHADIFKLFITQNNLDKLDNDDLSTLEIEFKFMLNYLLYKYDNTK